MITDEQIREAVRRLVETGKPEKILLFGSYARGDAGEKSDLDFLVVKREVKSRRKEMVRLHDAIRPLRIPVDILVISSGKFDEWSKIPGTVIYRAAREGKVCHAEF